MPTFLALFASLGTLPLVFPFILKKNWRTIGLLKKIWLRGERVAKMGVGSEELG